MTDSRHKTKLPLTVALPVTVSLVDSAFVLLLLIGADLSALAVTALVSIVFLSLAASTVLAVRHFVGARKAHANDAQSELKFEALIHHSSDVLVVVDAHGNIAYASPSTRNVYGYSAAELVGKDLDWLIAPNDRSRVRSLMQMTDTQSSVTMTAEWRAVRSDGQVRHLEVLLRNLTDEKTIGGTVLNIRDVTDRKELQDQLSHQAMHDDLTGLPNRSLLQSSVQKALSRYLFQGEVSSLLVIDLDDFRNVNDSFGHHIGDGVLKTLTERLRSCLRGSDMLVRLAADEFAILLPGLSSDDVETTALVDRIVEQVEATMDVDNRQIMMRASYGVACISDEVTAADDLLRNADLALHAAKVNLRGGWVKFASSMHDAAIHRAEMVADLREAIVNDEFQIFYQPTVDIATGAFEGVEALVRWPHATRGFVSPAEFIPVAEEAGLIVAIGTWVLEHACAQMAQWQARYPTEVPLILNVNLSGRQLAEPDVVDIVARVLKESGLRQGSLVLEMTESVLMDDQPAVLERMEAIRELGVNLAIDDFGTGYSSLSYLRQFPISVLKIDRAFVSGLGSDARADDAALVQAIIDLARTLQLRTVAEGIETKEQLAMLRNMGCDVGQGFLLAKPAPAEDVRRLIAKIFDTEDIFNTAVESDAQTVS